MSKRHMGPPPHTEDPYTRLTSPRGIPVDQLVSVLQKDIRRGHVDNAVLAAYEMLTTSSEAAEHMWHRLKVIAVEDIGMGEPMAPVLLNSLSLMPRRQRRDPLSAPAGIISGQACQLVKQPHGGEDLQEPLHLAGADMTRWDDDPGGLFEVMRRG